ncbi:LOG family protein [Roseococcus sp. XZZS9]|uniref:AMP nucleosidase n=2 Tax=Roseococcus pinisoli TaxID=2835040 RepID=A0ABS5QES5_9PROT|nr:LOG family protein [Roseococcus pinisoli]
MTQEDDKKMSSINGKQMASPSFRLPALDQDFLLGDSMRGVRFLLEYAKAEEALRAWAIRSTIVVFGSARVREDGPGPQPHWYAEARNFGRIASERGGALEVRDGLRDNVIATGGGDGIMGAANRGAAEAGAPSIGFNITLPHEQEPNAYSTPDLTFRFHYFAMRKMHLAMRANALLVFPGGFGTFDELFELLTLCQTGKSRALPIVLFDRAFWSKVVNMEALAEYGLIGPSDTSLVTYADSAEEAWSRMVEIGLDAYSHGAPGQDNGDETAGPAPVSI